MNWSGFRKAKDGPQQGTLFDVRDVPSQPVDSPGMQKRSRRAEMLKAMPQTLVPPTGPGYGDVASKVDDRAGPGQAAVTEFRATYQAGKQERALMAHRLADDTTVDPDTLRGLTRIDIGQSTPDPDTGAQYPRFRPGAAAHYAEPMVDRPVIQSPTRMPTGMLVHEIGHHESRYHNRNPRTGVPRVDTASGLNIDPAEEGRADAFSLEHTDKVTHTYASGAVGTDAESKFTGIQSPYRREREAAGQPLREWEGGRNVSPKQFSEQLAAFDVEPALAPESEASVQAYTRDEGREVVGWSADPEQNKHMPGRTGILKHEYDPEHEKPFTGANYASMFDDDIVPERHRDDWLDSRRGAEVVRQTWRNR